MRSVLLEVLICIAIGYTLGNINPSYVFAKSRGYDVRKDGSGNAGASNAFILAGKTAFLVSTLIDIFKAYAACKICRLLFPGLSAAAEIAGVACILGHMFPAVLGFRGGKGLACLGGVILAWNWRIFPLMFLLAAAIAFISQYMAFAAPSISLIFPGLFYLGEHDILRTLILLIPAIPIFWKHRENFRRIREGSEVKMSYIWNKEKELERTGRSGN